MSLGNIRLWGEGKLSTATEERKHQILSFHWVSNYKVLSRNGVEWSLWRRDYGVPRGFGFN